MMRNPVLAPHRCPWDCGTAITCAVKRPSGGRPQSGQLHALHRISCFCHKNRQLLWQFHGPPYRLHRHPGPPPHPKDAARDPLHAGRSRLARAAHCRRLRPLATRPRRNHYAASSWPLPGPQHRPDPRPAPPLTRRHRQDPRRPRPAQAPASRRLRCQSARPHGPGPAQDRLSH